MIKRKHLPIMLYLLFVLLGWLFIEFFYSSTPKPSIEIKELTNLQEKSIEIFIEMNKLIISFALLLIGGIGGFILQKNSIIMDYSLGQTLLIMLSLLLNVISIYFGYTSYFSLVEILSNSMLNLDMDMITAPQKYQFFSFTFAVLLFGSFIFTNVKIKTEELS